MRDTVSQLPPYNQLDHMPIESIEEHIGMTKVLISEGETLINSYPSHPEVPDTQERVDDMKNIVKWLQGLIDYRKNKV